MRELHFLQVWYDFCNNEDWNPLEHSGFLPRARAVVQREGKKHHITCFDWILLEEAQSHKYRT